MGVLDGLRRVVVLGCGRCASSCGTGGEKEVKEFVELLVGKGFVVVHSAVVEAQCDVRLSRKALKGVPEYDAVVSMACGSGAAALGMLTDKPVIPANNTLFLGVVKRVGDYVEGCKLCGDCILVDTEGICVYARCGKGLLNGPCGGSSKGKCEKDGVSDCGWALIVERMKKRGRLKNLVKKRVRR